MDLINLIKKRRSVRDYKDKLVKKNDLFKILEAARWSPSSGNVQNWRFIVITNDGLKIKLAEACLSQYWLSNAPILIVVASDDSKLRMLFGQRGETVYSIQNCSVAMQNIMLEAESLGLNSCWVGAYDEEKIKRVLLVDDPNISIRGLIAIGYAKQTPPPPQRISMDKIVFFNQYGNTIFR